MHSGGNARAVGNWSGGFWGDGKGHRKSSRDDAISVTTTNLDDEIPDDMPDDFRKRRANERDERRGQNEEEGEGETTA